MSETVTELLAAVARDTELAQRFTALGTIEQAVALADDLGFPVTAEELTAAIGATADEISDNELTNAAGGTATAVLCLPPTLALFGPCQ